MHYLQQITSTILLFFSAVITLASSAVSSSDWNYNDNSEFGPSNWHVRFPTCGGLAQSPIDVKQDHVEEIITDPIIFDNYESRPSSAFSLYNSGYGVNLVVPKNLFKIGGGSLPSVYSLEQMHFHWSQLNTLGSEHVVDRRIHPLEVHFVHYDSTKYSNVSSALQDPNGLAVVAVNVEITSEQELESSILGNITSALHKVIEYGNEAIIDSFPLEELLPKSREFYRYKGSLTTPECHESVHWTLFTESIYISHEQMMEFRNIKTSSGEILDKNFRPVQPINDRIIYHYFDTVNTSTTLISSWTWRIILLLSLTISYQLFL